MVSQEARLELEGVRQQAWEGLAEVREALTENTDLGPPTRAGLGEAQLRAKASSEDPPEVRRWLRGLEELTDAVTLASNPAGPPCPAPTRETPVSVAGYRILGELARGGMGVVYSAHDEALDRPVALKVLRGADLASDEDRRRFEIEARAAAGLRHPGIVAVHASGLDDAGNPYLVMDLIEGPSLSDLLREGPLEPRRAARLTRDVALALAHAHEAGVLHRDLKPANILLEGRDLGEQGAEQPSEERALLTDFGIAKRVDLEEGLTQTGQVLGTPAYMAPEQADGTQGSLDARTDVYGLGATLFDLLIGRPPFVAAGTWQLLNSVLTKDPPDPRTLRPELDLALSAICLRCLEKEPERRYPSARDLAADLDRYLAGEGVEARAPSLARRLRARLRRQRVPLLLAAVTLALLLAGGLGLGLRQAGVSRGHLDRAHRLVRLGAPAAEVLGAVESALAAGSSLETSLEAAQALRAAGLRERADSLLERAVREHPPGIEALLALHHGRLERGPSRFTDALARALEAARTSEAVGGRAAALRDYAHGEALLETDPGRAKELLTQAAALAPRFAWVYVARASAEESLGDPEEALLDLGRALEVDPRNFVALCNRGSILRAQGALDLARAEFEAAHRLDPDHDHPLYLLGALELEAKRYDESRRWLKQAEKLRGPRGGEALALLALCDEAQGRADEAQARARAALTQGAQGLPAARAHLLLAEAEGSDEAKLTHLDAALALAPDLVPALVLRGRLRGDRADLSRALDLDSTHTGALRARASLAASAKDLSAARRDLDSALGLDPGDAEAYLLRADLSVLEKDEAGGLRDYGNAIRARPNWAEPLIRRGVLQARLGQGPAAAKDWREALELLGPGETETRGRLNAWLEKLDR